VQTGSDVHQPFNQGVPGDHSPELKRPGSETIRSPPFSAEVKNAWSYTPQYVFMAWCLVKHGDKEVFIICLTFLLEVIGGNERIAVVPQILSF